MRTFVLSNYKYYEEISKFEDEKLQYVPTRSETVNIYGGTNTIFNPWSCREIFLF